MSHWPFSDPENVAVMTVRQVTHGGRPILLVSHDADDGMWQFLTGGPIAMADAMIVSLGEVYAIDPTIGKLADMPPGGSATRSAPEHPWQRQPTERVGRPKLVVNRPTQYRISDSEGES